ERRKLAALYRRELKQLSWLEPPHEPDDCRGNWQSYPVKILDHAPMSRDELMQRLLDAEISTRRGIMNAHQEPPYVAPFSIPHSKQARDAVILLPLYTGMTETEVEMVVKRIKDV